MKPIYWWCHLSKPAHQKIRNLKEGRGICRRETLNAKWNISDIPIPKNCKRKILASWSNTSGKECLGLTEEENSCITSEDINSFYTELWDPTPDITIPFKPTMPANKIACKWCPSSYHDARHQSADESAADPGPDGIEKKHIAKTTMKETLRLLFNLIYWAKYGCQDGISTESHWYLNKERMQG